MIEIQELRIGNIFHDEDKTPCYFAGAWERTDGWTIRDSAGNTYKPAHIYPIPLTPEILVKIGFKNRGGWHGLEHNTHIFDEPIELVFEVMDGALTVYSNDQRVSNTANPTLHQFQNLYFSLTNIELTVNI